MHRGRPRDGVLLHIKSIYPDGAYRVPTGGIHQGEAVFATLIREIYEETGLVVGQNGGEVQVERFLGVLSYRLSHRDLGNFDFATYPFLVRIPADAELVPQDPNEQIAGWSWRSSVELDEAARYLESVGAIDSEWTDWGHYRALVHRFLANTFRGRE